MKRLSNQGFTLIETLVVVVILAIGLAVAIPAFMEMGRSNAVKAEARSLKNLLARTRMDAVEGNQSLTATINVATNSCTITDTASGAVVSSTNFNGVQLVPAPNPLAIVWNTRGMTNNFCSINLVGAEGTYQVSVSLAGNIRIAKQ